MNCIKRRRKLRSDQPNWHQFTFLQSESSLRFHPSRGDGFWSPQDDYRASLLDHRIDFVSELLAGQKIDIPPDRISSLHQKLGQRASTVAILVTIGNEQVGHRSMPKAGGSMSHRYSRLALVI